MGDLMPRAPRRQSGKSPTGLSAAKLDALIEEATVDAYDQYEQALGFFSMLEEHLALPFDTMVLGVSVTVVELELRGDDSLVAICKRGDARQAIPLMDLPLPSPPPEGADWIEAYRRWVGPR
jgi:hypothetical protein